jgi:hypothetical protein
MELSTTREATSCAATQELTSIVWNLKVHYRIHKSFPEVAILSNNNAVHVNLSCLSEIHVNDIQLLTSWSSKWSLSL